MTNPNLTPPYRPLRRPTDDRMVAGVCSGIARYANVDPTAIRVLFALVGVLTGGVAVLAYPIMWFLMPEEHNQATWTGGPSAPVSPGAS